MADIASRIAACAGDAAGLLALAIELAEENAKLRERAVVLEARRFKDAERKRNRPRNSAEIHGNPQTSAEIPDVPPPQVSPSFPTPHITPSFPPTPLLPLPQGPEEARLADRAVEAWPTVVRFLAGKDETARTAWIGRFHGALDRPPHPTGAELRDALQDLMTQPREDWKPVLFRRYVERIRRDSQRDAERAAPGAPSRGRVLLDLFRRYDLFAYNGNADEYRAKQDRAASDSLAGPDFAAECNAVKPWKDIPGDNDHFKALEIEKRLATRATARAS